MSAHDWLNNIVFGDEDSKQNSSITISTDNAQSHNFTNRNKRCYKCDGMGHIPKECSSKTIPRLKIRGRGRGSAVYHKRERGKGRKRTTYIKKRNIPKSLSHETETKCINCSKLQKENEFLKQEISLLKAKMLTIQQENASLSYLITTEQTAINTYQNNDVETLPPLTITFDCQICLETQNIEAQHQISSCHHAFCRECLKNHVLNYPKAELPDCPLPNCHHKLSDYNDLQLLLTPTEYYKLHKTINQIEISKISDLKHCLTPDCDYAVQLIGGPRLDCRKCGNSWCTQCQTSWHSGLQCEQYQSELVQHRIRHRVQQRDDEFAVWRQHNRERVKTCPLCRNEVEKNGGCNHMRCRCGSHWCWSCRAVLDPHNLEDHFSGAHPMIDND